MDIENLFSKFESPTQKDIKLNFKKFFSDSGLDAKARTALTIRAENTRP